MRIPRGYLGQQHETIGSDILSVQLALREIAGEMGPGNAITRAEQVLGRENVERLKTVQADRWYPITWLLEMLETLDARIGSNALRRMGRALFKLSHEARVRQVAHSGRDIVYGIDGMYHHANRGQGIGGWEVKTFLPDRAEIEKTTPHHCALEEGILAAALAAVGSPAVVTQRACVRRDADACLLVVTPAAIGPSWTGQSTPTAGSSRPPKGSAGAVTAAADANRARIRAQ